MILTLSLALFAFPLNPGVTGSEAFEPAIRLKADGEFVDISKDLSYSGPWIVDRDGDGKRDLIVTSIKGKFRWYRNVGTNAAPSYEHKGLVKVNDIELSFHNW